MNDLTIRLSKLEQLGLDRVFERLSKLEHRFQESIKIYDSNFAGYFDRFETIDAKLARLPELTPPPQTQLQSLIDTTLKPDLCDLVQTLVETKLQATESSLLIELKGLNRRQERLGSCLDEVKQRLEEVEVWRQKVK